MNLPRYNIYIDTYSVFTYDPNSNIIPMTSDYHLVFQ